MKNEKKLVFLSDYASLYGGNFVPSLIALSKAAESEMGLKTVFLFPEAERSWIHWMQDNGYCIEFFDFSVGRKTYISNLELLAKKYQIEILHTHFTGLVNIGIFAKKHPEIKVFIHSHSDFSAGHNSLKQRIAFPIIQRVMTSNVRFLSVSSAFVAAYPYHNTYVPNALAAERIPSVHLSRNALREKKGVDSSDFFVEIFGWSPYVKGVDIAVNAVRKLNETSKYVVKLGIICGRNCDSAKMKSYIAQNTDCTGEEDYLIYLSPTEDVYGYHEAADIMLSASRSEGFPYSILEMLSLGKRCVISDIPGTAWAQKYETVQTFESTNIKSCRDMLEKAIHSPDHSEQVSKEIRSTYDIERWTRQIIDIYREKT